MIKNIGNEMMRQRLDATLVQRKSPIVDNVFTSKKGESCLYVV
jgi:hypothetical protein